MKLHSLTLIGLLALVSGTSFAQTPAPAPAAAPAAAPVKYKLDANKGFVYVQVFKDQSTLAASLSHDHVIRAKGWSGAVTWDPSNVGACQVEVNVPVGQLEVDAPEMRKKVGYDTVLDDSDRGTVREHMLAEDQLNSAKYPNISFKSTKCEGTGSAIKVTGNFTLHGVSKQVTVPMTLSGDGKAFTAKGSFKVKQSDFGYKPFEALLGQLKNSDEISFTIDVVGAP